MLNNKFFSTLTSGLPNSGINWVYRGSLGTDDLNAIVWTGSQFCAVGGDGKVATSPDGITWTNRTGLSSTAWGIGDAVESIVWTGTQFCVVGNSGKVATSPDGITWTYQSGLSSTAWGTSSVQVITWTGTQFCVVGNSGKVATS